MGQSNSTHKLVIIGAGPSGYSASLYASRAMLKPLVLAGPEPGGQLMYTTDVENYPGFPEGILGPELMNDMRKQATKFGSTVKFETATKIDTSKRPFKITSDSGEYTAEAVVLAMGAKSRMLEVGEEKFLGKGVSTCAVCDAAFFKGKDTYVVGGGDAAIEDAWALTKHASSVTMIVRKDEFRASKIMQKRVDDNPDKVNIMWNSEVVGVSGDDKLESIEVKDNKSGEKRQIKADGLFLAIGHIPATSFLKGSDIQMDKKGYVITARGVSEAAVSMASSRTNDGLVEHPSMTSVEGIFAAGDVVDFRYQQAVTAAGMGVEAALDAEWWLNDVVVDQDTEAFVKA